MAYCPNCPNRTAAAGCRRTPLGAGSEAAGSAGAGSAFPACCAEAGGAGLAYAGPWQYEDGPQPHPRCPSTSQLWAAARAELAELREQQYHWLGVFCDACGLQVSLGWHFS